ncbi:MAG: hypothetical protein VYE68_08525 [Acidobacteriota bacterium]|nr:hypothetical protein [Acidobacteriota bacterium]
MPFLRFSRDKRGYESTYLCHTYRRDGKAELRVLYWFRTPPNVEFGRLALDPDAIRAIEASNPGLAFDWDEILKAKPPPPENDGRGERRTRRRTRSTSSQSPAIVPPAESPSDDSTLVSAQSVSPQVSESYARARPLGQAPGSPTEDKEHVALALIDADRLTRLRARCAEFRARISARPREPAQLEALEAQARQLDPYAWSSVYVARERLAALEDTTAQLQRLLGRRRRRRGGARGRRIRRGESSQTDREGADTSADVREPGQPSSPDLGKP